MARTAAIGPAHIPLDSLAPAPATVPLQLTGDFRWLTIAFFALALVAALVGVRGVAGMGMEIARIAILVFVVLAVAALFL